MAPGVVVVTDSTADLPAGVVESLGIRVVPLHVVIDGRSFAEGQQIGPDEVAQALVDGRSVTTSRPAPAELAAVYAELAAGGARAVVSIHLSRHMSGTYDAAVTAARAAPLPVSVVDSGSLAMGLGYPVLAAARLAQGGAGVAAVGVAARACIARTATFFYVDTLEYLRRGGRIGGAAALLGTALSVKPLLAVREGRVVPVDRFRTATRALERLEQLALGFLGGQPGELTVQHVAAAERAEQVAAAIRSRLPAGSRVDVTPAGAVVGVHAGPGMIGIAVTRSPG